jgi:hypothetical protein
MLKERDDLQTPSRIGLSLKGSIAFVKMDSLPLNSIFEVKIAESCLRNGFGRKLQTEEGNSLFHWKTSLLKKGLFAQEVVLMRIFQLAFRLFTVEIRDNKLWVRQILTAISFHAGVGLYCRGDILCCKACLRL